jgi:mono/diheme cytochrome c family protein
LRGLALIDHYGCTSCHRDDAIAQPFPFKQAPNLAWGSGRIDPNYLFKFISDPQHVKPGTSMPDMLSDLPEKLTLLDQITRDHAAAALAMYITSLSSRTFARTPTDSESVARGRELFHKVGCVACHSPRGEEGKETLSHSSTPLGSLASKYSVEGLTEFLENPLAARPSGRMPQTPLTHWEATDLANYLWNHDDQKETSDEEVVVDRSLVAEGSRYFQQFGCVNCHGVSSGIELSSDFERVIPSMKSAREDQGCLSGKPGTWPKYELNESERSQIKTALRRETRALGSHEQVTLTMQAFNCVACHQRGDASGVSDERDSFFTTENQNLGPQGRIPPNLNGVGAKLNSKWLRDVLVSGRPIRPYLHTRMPLFGADNVGHLVELFDKVDAHYPADFAEVSDEDAMRKSGFALVGNRGLNCVACHTFTQIAGETMPAVDLTEMAERLRKEWFYHYMLDPQRHNPNTVMPSFWPGGRAMRKDILEGDSKMQIEALWQYLLEDRQARTPQGLINEPMELVATDEAVMLRRSYEAIAKRGIGVGYPGQVNLAYDAEQMRLVMIWKGKFADPSGVWKSQGHGNVRPLGDARIRFDMGPDLDDADHPWVFELPEEIAKLEQPNARDVQIRPPQHQFKGYTLDELQRPKLMYHFDNVEVEDYPMDVLDEKSGKTLLRRTLTLTSEKGRPRTAFRAASGESIAAESDGSFVVGKGLNVRIVSDHPGKIVEGASGQQLIIPLDLAPGKTTLILEYRW